MWIRKLSSKVPTNLKGKKVSSQLWLARQLKDPYVEKAKMENYRCRSAFKLIEMNQKHKLLNYGDTVCDIGTAPGSWAQVCVKAVNSDHSQKDKPKGTVIGIDRLQIYPLEGVKFFGNCDFTDTATHEKILQELNGKKVDCVLSDMAPNATGIRSLDQENIMELANSVFDFAQKVSAPNGSLVIKVWSNGELAKFVERVKEKYEFCRNVKPDSSRADSAEIYVLAKKFKAS